MGRSLLAVVFIRCAGITAIGYIDAALAGVGFVVIVFINIAITAGGSRNTAEAAEAAKHDPQRCGQSIAVTGLARSSDLFGTHRPLCRR